MMSLLYPLIAAIIGAFVGRFIAFTTLQLPKILMDEEEENEPSDLLRLFLQSPHCWNCQGSISRLENFPVMGYLFSKGKCKKCQQPHSKRIIFLELGVALLFGITLAFFPVSVPTLFVLAASCLLIAAFITDFEHKILPDQVTLTLLWLGLIGSLYPVFVTSREAILGAVVGYGFFWAMNAFYRYFRGFEGMYPGDFKLNAAIGACVGVQWLIPIILLSFAFLVIFSIVAYIFQMRKVDFNLLHYESPYGCYSSLMTISVFYLYFSNLTG